MVLVSTTYRHLFLVQQFCGLSVKRSRELPGRGLPRLFLCPAKTKSFIVYRRISVRGTTASSSIIPVDWFLTICDPESMSRDGWI